jgi:D-alanyl-D-alanine-carboxypeptidase/D-alanyl-D-alanine-endopeptidase
LDRKAGSDYESLVRTRITGPLGMSETRIALTPGMQSRLAPGHDASLRPVPNWDIPAFAAAGALRSTANDLLKFIAAELGYSRSPLLPAMKAMLTVRRPTGGTGADVALAWQVRTLNDKEIFWHNGGTGGYRTFIGFDPKAGVGVVGLSNVAGLQGVDDIGTHVLDPAAPVITPPAQAAQIALDPKVLEGYVGNYQLAPSFFLAVTREGDQLYVQATNQGRDEIFASAEREFFSRRVDARITFQADAAGRASALVLHQNGRDMPAPRIEGELPKPAEHKEIAVDAKTFDGYVGEYQLAPGFTITVTRSGDGLFVQLTGQPMFQVYPQSERDFFYKVVDAQLTFQTDAAGKATKVTLHQNGGDMPAPRK